MRSKIALVVTIAVVVGLLLLVNSISQVSEEQKQDSEIAPNRSTYHAGPTGTRALYDLLNESGVSVMRWRDVPEKLLNDKNVRTFVIVGNTQLSITESEAQGLLRWVNNGGTLVLVDRNPDRQLLPPSGQWTVSTQFLGLPSLEVNPGDAEQMIQGVKAIAPGQTTLLTTNVDEVMPSRFAAAINLSVRPRNSEQTEHPVATGIGVDDEDTDEQEGEAAQENPAISPAPVIHLGDDQNALLVDYPHGAGRIIVLSDPYIVSNGGLSLRDNVQLAINVVRNGAGLIAFDEFHQGHGVTRSAMLTYFSGTPVLGIAAQVALLILVLLWSQGRRFARPLPLPSIDRRSTLEFVASMAEVQQRARAFDLAIENVYSRTRRVLTRYAGLDYNSPRSEIAARVAMRSSVDARQLEILMRQCEEAINGQEISAKQSVYLVKRLREIEASLGLRMRSRDAKQAAQNVAS